MNIPERIAAFRARMAQEGFAAVIVPTADSHASEYIADTFKTRQWLCGFTGSAGTLVVGREEAALFTDGRYFIQAERQLAGSGVSLMRMGTPGVPSVEAYACSLAGNGKAGVDFGVVSAQFADSMAEKLAAQGAKLCDTGDWFDALWADRPALPKAPAYLLEEKYTGRSVADKLNAIREEMVKAGTTLHVTNVLDDIAWMLNVRGSDVHCTPVVMSYLAVSTEDAVWYVDTDKVDAAVQAALAQAGVAVQPYDAVEAALGAVAPGTRVMADTTKLTAKLCAALAKAQIVQHENPAKPMKAIKNDVELANLRMAHIRDGAAVTRLMYWLKTQAGKTAMTELSVDEKLLSLRREQEGFISPSFDTICAYRANAAMMHYKATAGSVHAQSRYQCLLSHVITYGTVT